MLKKWAGEIALTLRLQISSDSVQLFEDEDNATSNVFTEVFEGFIDGVYEDGQVRLPQSPAQAWCKPKAHVLQTHRATRLE
jgi:hypothetical protein